MNPFAVSQQYDLATHDSMENPNSVVVVGAEKETKKDDKSGRKIFSSASLVTSVALLPLKSK